ncbi:MAG TPA: adenylate/guanylate cyclase domain-containing protein [Candidatus Ozemobacteraceae bacterium]|nr:adenylate/guanylate cyclase domain-containing protein [Candidatus Ozemobacteraceae bacterium]
MGGAQDGNQGLEAAALGLSVLLLIPMLLGLFLVERFLTHYREIVLQQQGDLFNRVARNVGENLKPENVLWNIFTREFPNAVDERLASEPLPILAERAKRAMGIPSRVLAYDADGALVYPAGNFPNRELFAELNLTAQRMQFEPGASPPSLEQARRIRRFCQDTYGQPNPSFFRGIRRFGYSFQQPGQPRKHLGAYFLPKNQATPYQAVLHIEVTDRDLPSTMRYRNGLRALPDEVAFGAVVSAGSGEIIEARGDRWFPASRLNDLPTTGEAGWHPEGVILKKPLAPANDGYLVLAVPAPWFLQIPGAIRLFIAAVIAGGWFWGCHFVAGILVGRIRLSVGLGWQIAFAFGFAGSVPLLALAYLGSSRFIALEEMERAHWTNLMQKQLTRTDRDFRNQLESIQSACLDFSREAALKNTGELKADRIPAPLQPAHTIFLADAAAPGFSPRLYSSMIANPDQALGARAGQLKKVILDLFLQILRERGQLKTADSANKAGLELTVQDILGESSPILEMVKTLDEVTPTEFNQTRYISLCHIGKDRPNRTDPSSAPLRTFALFVFDAARESSAFFRDLCAHPPLRAGPFRVIPVHPEYGGYWEPTFDSDLLREAVERTRETQTSETIRYRNRDGIEFLGVTAFTHALAGQFPVGVMPYGRILETRDHQGRIVILLFLAGLVLILAVSVTLRNKLVAPLRQLKAGAGEVAGGRLDHRLPVASRDELGMLAGAFNEMLQGLQERERMRRFVSRTALSDIREEQAGRGSGIHGRIIRAAILCSDIRDFTTISERHPPDHVVEMLNAYFTEMDFLLQSHGGEIQKLVGDAIVAVFHEGEELAHPALRAVQAGLEMRAAVRRFNADRRKTGRFEIENGIGIHFDQVVEGNVGAAGGRLDFTVIGPAIARAQALESLSKHTSVSKVILSKEAGLVVAGTFAMAPLPATLGEGFEILPGITDEI